MVLISQFGRASFYCSTIAYHVELNAILGSLQAQPTSKKNRRLVLANASQGSESCLEIPHDPPSFPMAAICTDVFYCKERSSYFIALIHPIQWTIALSPNSRKRHPVYTTGRTGHSVHSLGGALLHYFLWIYLMLDTETTYFQLKSTSGFTL